MHSLVKLLVEARYDCVKFYFQISEFQEKNRRHLLAYHREKVNLTVIFLFLFVTFALLFCLCFTKCIRCLLEYLGSFLSIVSFLALLVDQHSIGVLSVKLQRKTQIHHTSAFSCHPPLHGFWFLGKNEYSQKGFSCLLILFVVSFFLSVHHPYHMQPTALMIQIEVSLLLFL